MESIATQEAIPQIFQTTEFHDAGVTSSYDENTSYYESQDYKNQAPLADFLKRPVRLISFTWSENNSVKTIRTMNPWSNFINNASIKNKIENYAFIRFDLKVRIITNASPFYYGAMLVNYQPLIDFKPLLIANSTFNYDLISYSQLPHLWIYPQENTSSEMTLPFICPVNYLRTAVNDDFVNMGLIRFINYTELDSANGATGQGVSVQAFGWAENVKLIGPTNSLLLQSDEYSEGPISKVASAVSRAASFLTDIPVIGRFARATEIGMSALGRISGLFGFSNLPQLDSIKNVRPVAFPPMATVDNVFGLDKLTLDSKNELTIDPRIFGDNGEDQLNIVNYCSRESYVAQASWLNTDAVDTLKLSAAVHPYIAHGVTGTVSTRFMCPLAHMSMLFRYWRGDIIYRFVVVSSKYHKGRLRFIYDPYGLPSHDATTEDGSGAVCISQIFDLGSSNEFEVRVPYQQPSEWCATTKIQDTITGLVSTNAKNHIPFVSNGQWSLKVQTVLTAPVATAPVSIMVFVRAAENIEFASPYDGMSDAIFSSYAVPQAEVVEGIINEKQPVTENSHLIYMGERVLTANALIKRMTLSLVLPLTTDTVNPLVLSRITINQMPALPGYDNFGLGLAKGVIVPAATFSYNATLWSPLLWLTPCFLAYRGSINLSVNYDSQLVGNTVPGWARIIRSAGSTRVTYGAEIAPNGTSTNSHMALFHVKTSGGISGQSVTNPTIQPNLSVNLPYYNNGKFSSTDFTNFTDKNTTNPWANLDANWYIVEHVVNSTTVTAKIGNVQFSYGAGPDFSVGFFLCVPTVFFYASPDFSGL